MRTAVVTMVRDECDILPAFIAHHEALVDVMFFADHRSVDGTYRYLQRLSQREQTGHASVELFRFGSHPDLQREVCGLLARQAFTLGFDWVIFLDADEFLPFASAAELKRLCAQRVPG